MCLIKTVKSTFDSGYYDEHNYDDKLAESFCKFLSFYYKSYISEEKFKILAHDNITNKIINNVNNLNCKPSIHIIICIDIFNFYLEKNNVKYKLIDNLLKKFISVVTKYILAIFSFKISNCK